MQISNSQKHIKDTKNFTLKIYKEHQIITTFIYL